MVKLRLRRRGRKKHPFYDIIAIDGRARRDGASIERVGYIDPMTSPKHVVLDEQRTLYWLNVGAQPTEVVRQILSREGVLLRRHLAFKNKPQEEIEAAVQQHKQQSTERYLKLKQRRTERASAKSATTEQPTEEPEASAASSEPHAKDEQSPSTE